MYRYYNPNPRGRWWANDCVIRAIAKATGDDWESIYAGLSAYGFIIGDWGDNNGVWDAYLRDNGFKRYILPNECPYCYTVADFVKDHPTGIYILATGRHAVTVLNGDWYDSWNSGEEVPIYYYTRRRYRAV